MELHENPDDPCPALTRGVLLLNRLCTDGPSSLEKLAATTGWPKSSVFRLLATLEALGAVERDPTDRRYRAVLRLVPFAPVAEDIRARALEALKKLCAPAGHTVELFANLGGQLTMIERCEPEGHEVAVRARIGWRPDPTEAFALTFAHLAWADDAQPGRARYWQWNAGVRQPVSAAELRKRVELAREQQIAICAHPNTYGVRRYAVPVRDASGNLWGVLAIAAVPAPLKGAAHERLVRLVLNAAQALNRSTQNQKAS